MKVTKDTVIGDIIDFNEGTKEIFAAIGMHCFDCPVSRMESVEEACAVHGQDANELIRKLNQFLGE